MSHGFLGNDASFMLDVVVCALVLLVPLLLASVSLVKFRKTYLLHRNLQIALGAILLLTVAAFEIDLQWVHGGWLNIANRPGRPPRLQGDHLAVTQTMLRVHLIFAISTPVLWALTLVLALRRYSNPPLPGRHSRLHKALGWWSVVDLIITSLTGLVFYWLAFIAE